MVASRFLQVLKRDRICRKRSDMQLRNASANSLPVAGVRRKRFGVWALVQFM
jgi:hypothetical protein